MTEVPPPPAFGVPAASSTQKNALGTWSLVLGIASIVCCLGIFAGIPAIILGLNSKKAGAQGLATNSNLGNVGYILGIIGCVLGVISFIVNALNGFSYNFSTN